MEHAALLAMPPRPALVPSSATSQGSGLLARLGFRHEHRGHQSIAFAVW